MVKSKSSGQQHGQHSQQQEGGGDRQIQGDGTGETDGASSWASGMENKQVEVKQNKGSR